MQSGGAGRARAPYLLEEAQDRGQQQSRVLAEQRAKAVERAKGSERGHALRGRVGVNDGAE
jgi:hypothetical protein